MASAEVIPGLGSAHLGKKRKDKAAAGKNLTATSGGGDVNSISKKKRSIDGYGTDGGVYAHPDPDVNICHLKMAFVDNVDSDTPRFHLQAAANECIR